MSGRGLTYFEQHFFFSNKFVRFLIRTCPNQSSNEQLSLLCSLIVYVLPLITHQIYTLNMELLPSIKILQSMGPSLYFLSFYYRIYISLTELKILIAHIKLDYKFMIHKEELKIMKKNIEQSKLFVYILTVMLSVVTITIIYPSILSAILHIFGITDDSHLKLPFSINKILHSGLLYYSLLIYQVTAIFIINILGILLSSFAWIILQHVIGQFHVMIFNIRQPFKSNQKEIENIWLSTTLDRENSWMINLIKIYTRITKFIDIFNSIAKDQYLIAVFFSMLIVFLNFLYIFQLSSLLQNTIETIESFVYLVGSLFTVYICFYIGQLLINHSDDVFKELSCIPFYNLSIKSQKLLLFVLTRTMKLSKLSIGGLFVATHEVFASLIQKAFSFATVFYSIFQV